MKTGMIRLLFPSQSAGSDAAFCHEVAGATDTSKHEANAVTWREKLNRPDSAEGRRLASIQHVRRADPQGH